MPHILLQQVTPVPALPGRPAQVDVLIGADGRVAHVGPDLPVPPGAQVVAPADLSLSPGWTDLHTHIYYGATDISVRPSDAGLATGVTTLVDAGSAGEANFHGFREYIAERADEDVYAFLNLGSIGLVACNRVSELRGIESIDVDRTYSVIDHNRDLVRGLKIRASHVITGGWDVTPLKIAKKLSRAARVPLMVHIGEPPPLVDDVLALLDPGDIVTHCYNGKIGGNLFDDNAVTALARQSLERGVTFDVGHGGASFSYAVAARALAEGLRPYTLSTDLHAQNIDGPVFDLATTLSKLYALGMTVDELIAAVTFHPAQILGLPLEPERWLHPGAPATFTLFSLEPTDLAAADSLGHVRTLETFIRPHYTLKDGQLRTASSRFLEQAAAGLQQPVSSPAGRHL